MSSAHNTREHVLAIALELFNERGAHAISTNHIAEAAGISTGTLYYHYRSKREIVLALIEKIGFYDDAMEQTILSLNTDKPAAFMEGVLQELVEHNWRFRFFKRDIMSLTMADTELGEIYAVFQEERIAKLENFLRYAVEVKALKMLEERTLSFLARQLWLNTHFWNAFLSTQNKKLTKENTAEINTNVRLLLQPYLSKSMRDSLQAAALDGGE